MFTSVGKMYAIRLRRIAKEFYQKVN